MVDTPRSKAALLAASADNTTGNYTNQSNRDLISSVLLWDDPSNVQGLSAPAIVRATASTYGMVQSGQIVAGAGISSGNRTANATALNNLFSKCVSQGLFCEIYPATYEFTSSTGLIIPANGNGYALTLRGSAAGSFLIQFYNSASGAPILTIGDPSGAGGTQSVGLDVSGLQLQYGSSQTGLTAASGLVLGQAWDGVIENIFVNNFTNAPFDAVSIPDGFFSMNIRNIFVWGMQRHGMRINANATGSTGNHYDNIYMTAGGNPTFPLITGNFLRIENSVQDMHFNRLNCEWTATNAVISTPNGADGLVFTAMHLEGIQFSGANPVVFDGAQTARVVNGFELVTPQVAIGSPVASPMSGVMALTNDFNDDTLASSTQISGLNYVCFTGGAVTAPINMCTAFSTLFNDESTVIVENFRLKDDIVWRGVIGTDAHLNLTSANVLVQSFARYEYGVLGSRISKAKLKIFGTFTLYGQFEDTTIFIPVSITSFTLTLAATMGATGTQKPRTGNTVHVRRQSGTASGTLTVAFGGTGTPSTNTTAATSLYYQFDGTNWQTFTPVT